MLTAEELKIKLGDQAKDIISSGIGLHGKGQFVLCPVHDDNKPSMSWFEDGLMWRCHSCQSTIDIYTYLTEYQRMSFQEAMKHVAELVGETINFSNSTRKKEYVLPNIKTNQLGEAAIKYMAIRKISKQTLIDWKVEQRNWNGKDVYVFNYYDEFNENRFVSYRGIGKGAIKGGCEKGTEPILWGMWHTVKDKPLVITEGQPDAMAVWESGYKNVVSVPNGAKNFKWIDSCWDYINKFEEIIVFYDNDRPGYEFAKELQSRLENVKIVTHNKYKDANEVLYHIGPEEVLKMINDTINILPENLIDVSKLEYKFLSEVCHDGIETGLIDIDEHLEDLKPGELTILFGRNGEGKSTVISQIISHNLKRKVKTFLFSGELSPQKVQEWQYKQMVGNNKDMMNEVKTKYKIKREPKPHIVKAIKQWHEDIWYLYDKKVDTDFFKTMSVLARRYGVRLFIIDNLMTVLEENAESLYSDQANFVQKCKDFAIQHNCHLILAGHPNKSKQELDPETEKGNLEKTDISGSNNIPNKADNIISVERLFGDGRICDAIVSVLKDREEGQRKVIHYNFSKRTLRFYNDRTHEAQVFGWEKTIPIIINQENKLYKKSIERSAPWD